MLKMFKSLMPKETAFFDLFARHADALKGGAEVMARMFAHQEDIGVACARIATLENDADQVTREVLHAVRRTFVTPFDRSAITGLISSMDDALDEKASGLVAQAVPLLSSIGRNHRTLDQTTEQIVHLEEEADNLHDAGLKALFQRHREGNAMGYIVGREIYSHLEKVLDRLEDVANEISGIVIDHA
jgi:uncharacterized protein Yka (UPF0111/DUF47 family)